MRVTTRLLLLASLPLTGCVEDAIRDSFEQFPLDPETTGSSTSTTGEPAVPTTDVPGVYSVTSAPGSTDEPQITTADDPPPVITQFFAEANLLEQAGAAQLTLVTSDDVIKATLSRSGDSPDFPKSLTLADFPLELKALTAKDNDDYEFTVVVEDAAGQTAEATTTWKVDLPEPGVPVCLYEDKDMGATTSVVAALVHHGDAILAVGTRDLGKGPRIAVWKLDPDDCQPLPGWPRELATWTAKKQLTEVSSFGTAVAVDAHGTLLVAGNLDLAGKPQPYVAGLTLEGVRLWEQEGQPGDHVAGIAPAAGQFSDRLFVVGSRRTSDAPIRTDAAIWTYQISGNVAFIPPATILKAPFTADEPEDLNNKRNERALAVSTEPMTGDAMIVGERDYVDSMLMIKFDRAFSARFHPLGGLQGSPWTSQGASFLHDGLSSTVHCGDHFVAGGWTRDDLDPNAKPQPFLLSLNDAGEGVSQWTAPDLTATEVHGVACDAEEKVFSAATRSSNTIDTQIFTVADFDSQYTSFEAGVSGDDGAGAASCSTWGLCAWGGYRSTAGKSYAVVRVFNP